MYRDVFTYHRPVRSWAGSAWHLLPLSVLTRLATQGAPNAYFLHIKLLNSLAFSGSMTLATDIGSLVLRLRGGIATMQATFLRPPLHVCLQVDLNTPFAPIARKEIGGMAWHLLSELPATKEAASSTYHNESGTRHKFFNVYPYMKQLKRWVKNRRRTLASNPGGLAGKSRGNISSIQKCVQNCVSTIAHKTDDARLCLLA